MSGNEGIIQNIFNKYAITLVTTNIQRQFFNEMEKELIKDIKLMILSVYEQNPRITATALKIVQKELIGDNQE